MSDSLDFEKTLVKLNKNNYDVTELTEQELEELQKYVPGIMNSVNRISQLGEKSQEKVYHMINQAIETFSDQLKNPNLSPEERDKLNDRIENMVEKAIKKDTEFKKWTGTLVWLGIGGTALLLAGKNPEMREAALKMLGKGESI